MLRSLAEKQIQPMTVALFDIHINYENFNQNLRHRQIHLIDILRNCIKHIVVTDRHQSVLRLDDLDLSALCKRCRQELYDIFGAQMLELNQE